jgi:acetyl esterase
MISEQRASYNIKPEQVHKVEDKIVWTGSDSIKIRLYYPGANKNLRIIYNIHGGALVAGDLETHDNISRVLANRCNAIVVAVDYRKPPEAPYPSGLDDCMAVLNWIRINAKSFGGDGNNIIFLGDSGGGLFATSMQIRLQRTFIPLAIILVNPAVDLRNIQNPIYQLVASWYLNGRNASDSVISPTLAANVSFFPPTLIVTSEKDELKEQAVNFYNKLIGAGVKTQWLDLPAQDHLGGLWAANHPEAQKAINETVRFINSIPKK